MNTYKKTIFLVNRDKMQSSRALLTLEKKHNGIFCTIKAYNLDNPHNLILGIKTSQKIIKQNIILNHNICSFLLPKETDLDNIQGYVLMEENHNEIKALMWNTDKCNDYKSAIVKNLKDSINKLSTISKTNITEINNNINNNSSLETKVHIPDRYEFLPIIEDALIPNNDNNLINNSSNKISDSIISPISSNIKENYKYELSTADMYSQISMEEEIFEPTPNAIESLAVASNLFEDSEEEINDLIDSQVLNPSGNEHKFYTMIAEQLEELFDKYPRETNLQRLIDNSRWVKINYEDDDDKFYVVGIIYIDNDIKYICYGVPGDFNTEPPLELKDYSQWLPINPTNPYQDGYWVMYQDADTGENVYIR